MKSKLPAGLAMLFICVGSGLCSGQCTEGFNYFTAYCANSKGCSGSVSGMVPSNPSPYGSAFYANPLTCCGSIVASFSAGGECVLVELRSPEIQRRLAQLAADADVLVADCGGRYALYVSSPENGGPGRNPDLLTDHLPEERTRVR